MDTDYDIIVIGSGFGGSVPALRLTEKGYRVVVVEQGRRITPDDMRAADERLRDLVWLPQLGFRGFFVQHVFKHVGIVGGVGVGGGSLVYAAVLLRPGEGFFADPAWSQLGVDWRAELADHYERASQMLGVTRNPDHSKMDDWLQATAESMGAGDSFGSVDPATRRWRLRSANGQPVLLSRNACSAPREVRDCRGRSGGQPRLAISLPR